ncbi:MAG: nucleotidyl transferase AbiEii/AbiGii toxin family protein [Beutenbergiaceae bacterium]
MPLLLDIATAFEQADVDYVIVGGMAVVLHGHTRMTVDIDLALDLETENLTRALDLLQGLGLRPRLPVRPQDFIDQDTRESWISERNLIAFTMHDPADARREVDIFAHSPIPFQSLSAAAEVMYVGQTPIRVVSLPHLIALKEQAGRPQDLADIAALRNLPPGRRLDRS